MKNFFGFVVVLATAVATATAVQDIIQLHPSVGAKSGSRDLGIFSKVAANVAKGIDNLDLKSEEKEDCNRDRCDDGDGDDDDDENTWMIIGVVVGVAAGVAVVGFVGVMIFRRRSQRIAATSNVGGNTRFATGPPQTSPAPIIVVKPAPPTEYPEIFASDKRVPKGHANSAHADFEEPQAHSSSQRVFESREPAYNPEYVELQPVDHSSMVEVDLQEPPPSYEEIATKGNSDWTYELYVDPDTKAERY